jgi:hypothetical protein
VRNPPATASRFDDFNQALEFAHALGIAAAVPGNHDAVIVLLRSDHACTSGSIWLGIGFSVRMSMMLISLKSAVQAASEPLHAASDCVSVPHFGRWLGMPRQQERCDVFRHESHGHGITIAFRHLQKRVLLNGSDRCADGTLEVVVSKRPRDAARKKCHDRITRCLGTHPRSRLNPEMNVAHENDGAFQS